MEVKPKARRQDFSEGRECTVQVESILKTCFSSGATEELHSVA